MKKFAFMLLFIFLFNIFFPMYEVLAEVTYTFDSGTYHVVWITDDITATACDNISTVSYDNTNIEYIKSFDTYDEALTYMDTLESTDEKIATIIGEKKNKSGAFVNSILTSQYALVDLNTTGTTLTTTNVYTSATNTNAYTYINGNGAFGGVDAALVDYNNGTTRVNMRISGVTGWINSLLYLNGSTYSGYDVVPLTSVKSPSYYYVNDNGELVHRLSKKITAESCYSRSITLGPAPTSLTATDTSGDTIKYYSYDGIYFYTTLEDMIDDYKEDSTGRAVNNIPYYNYYLYLPIRSQTNITADDIDAYMESRGFTTESSSVLYGITDLTPKGVTEYTNSLTEDPAPYSSLDDYMEQKNIDVNSRVSSTFINAQNNYGVNAATALSTAINESAWGTSFPALNYYNLFGHNVYDSGAGTGSIYTSIASCINEHAYYMIDTLFAETKDIGDRYHGSHLGNKGSGINVKYASDPYWGEKIASYYYSLDNYNDMKDYYNYSVGIKVSNVDAKVKTEASTDSSTLYTLKSYRYSVYNLPVIILERVVGEDIEGNNIWYKIQSDALIDEEGNLIQDVSEEDRYDWTNNIGYVHSSYITLMDSSVNKIYTKKTGVFGLENLSLNEDKTINIKGYLGITGMNNDKTKTITYDLVLQDETTNMTYELPLNRILDSTNIPFTVTYDKYDYSYTWFDGTIDLSTVLEGNYMIYVRARSGEYESKEILSNILSRNTIKKFTDSEGRGYRFRTNYYLKTIPLELFIRDDGLISDSVLSNYDNMINQYHEVELKDGKLNISGSSFNIGGNYSTTTTVTRTIVFENTSTYERYEYNLGYIDNGPYQITLIVSDGLNKTRAWFDSSVDISELPKGNYAIYIKTKSNVEDYDELNDIFSRDITTSMTSDDKIYNLSINDSQRFRLELTVK